MLFLKNAIALILLVAVSLGVFSGLMLPLLGWRDASGILDPHALALIIVLWIGTAVTFPWLRRLAAFVVDRAVLRRADYEEALAHLSRDVEAAETEAAVTERTAAVIKAALAVADIRVIEDPVSVSFPRLAMTGPALRAVIADVACVALVRLRTAEPPYCALALGPPAAGRRLLSDDLHWLDAVARTAATRTDTLRVSQERLSRTTARPGHGASRDRGRVARPPGPACNRTSCSMRSPQSAI